MFYTSRWCNWQIYVDFLRGGVEYSKKSFKARKEAHLSIRPVCTHKKARAQKKSWRTQKSSISIRSPFPPQTTHNKAKAKKKHPTQLAAQKKRKKDLSLSLSFPAPKGIAVKGEKGWDSTKEKCDLGFSLKFANLVDSLRSSLRHSSSPFWC